jgi:ribose 5-phosphate isomerase A
MNGNPKMRAAERAVEFIKPGQIVGLGTGSTAAYVLEALGRMVREGLEIRGVPTSRGSETVALRLGIPLLNLNDVARIDLTIDGADEIDGDFNMIKGGGGALTREKLVALASDRRVIVVDSSKLVSPLGTTRPLPVEVLPFSWSMSAGLLKEIGGGPVLRIDGERPFVTDNSNYILDCHFGPISDPPSLERRIKQMPGVIESGLFIGIADTVIVGDETEVRVLNRNAA